MGNEINEEKQKKLKRYKDEKEGLVKTSTKETCDFLLREVKRTIIYELYTLILK